MYCMSSVSRPMRLMKAGLRDVSRRRGSESGGQADTLHSPLGTAF
jgi:hypothetical protein